MTTVCEKGCYRGDSFIHGKVYEEGRVYLYSAR